MKKNVLSKSVKQFREGLKKRGASLLRFVFRSYSFPLFGLSRGIISHDTSDGRLVVDEGIATSRGAILDAKKRLISTYYVGLDGKPPQQDELFEASFSRFFPKITKVKEPLISLATPWQNAFYHWFYEVLPKLQHVKGERVFAEKHLPFQRESLELLGIKNVISEKMVKAPSIIVPKTPPGPTLTSCTFLKTSFKPHLTKKEHSRLYVSRSDATRRRILNEATLIDALKARGFTVIIPSKLTLLEQMNHFYAAEVVVAPHGAALSHLVFCEPKTKVLEIFSPHYINTCYKEISSLVNLDYTDLFGKSIGGRVDPDIEVEIDQILKSIPR